MIRDVHQHVIWLVVGIPTPLKNDGMSSSVGMMTFPTEWNVIQNSMVPVTTNQSSSSSFSSPYRGNLNIMDMNLHQHEQ